MASTTNDNLQWIHCNKCFIFLVQQARLLVLSTCGHVLCTDCILRDESGLPLCFICRKHVDLLPINNQLPQKYKVLFHPRPWEDSKNWIAAVQFQSKQRKYLARAVNIAESMFREAQKMKADLENEIKEAFQRREAYRKRRKMLEDYVSELKENQRRKEARITLQPKAHSFLIPSGPVKIFRRTPYNHSFQIPRPIF